MLERAILLILITNGRKEMKKEKRGVRKVLMNDIRGGTGRGYYQANGLYVDTLVSAYCLVNIVAVYAYPGLSLKSQV